MSTLPTSLPHAAASIGAEARQTVGRQLLRGASFVLALCVAIAAVLTVAGKGGFGINLVHSLCIGLICWLIIDGGRHAVAFLRNRARLKQGLAQDPHRGFPGWPWMIGLVLLGLAIGPVAGTALAGLFGAAPMDSQGALYSGASRTIWLVSLLASAASVITLTLLERLAQARADAEAARRAAAENQLKLLESQLEPHMLFNTLANLRVLIAIDPARAQAMLDRLIAFLRATLNASRSGMHPLATEFERIGDYLALMQVRMGARLLTQLDLPHELRDIGVPPLLLQPLVENSIKHGLEPKVAGGRVEVSALREGAMLVLSVRDSGVGLDAAGGTVPGHTHFGLQQVRERLRSLYAGRASLELQDNSDGGTLARIRLPLDR